MLPGSVTCEVPHPPRWRSFFLAFTIKRACVQHAVLVASTPSTEPAIPQHLSSLIPQNEMAVPTTTRPSFTLFLKYRIEVDSSEVL